MHLKRAVRCVTTAKATCRARKFHARAHDALQAIHASKSDDAPLLHQLVELGVREVLLNTGRAKP